MLQNDILLQLQQSLKLRTIKIRQKVLGVFTKKKKKYFHIQTINGRFWFIMYKRLLFIFLQL